MEQLGTFFLILTPFGFLCTENGTGMITGLIFLILGLLFKWLAKNKDVVSGGITKKHYVPPEEFWKDIFLNRYNGLKETKKFSLDTMIIEQARAWADDVTRAHGGTPPSDTRFEQIMKEMGLKTKKVVKSENEYKSRVRVAERCYMYDLVKKYEGRSEFTRYIHILQNIGDEIWFFHPTTNLYITYCSIDELREILKTISVNERIAAKEKVDEFEKKVVSFLTENQFDCNGTELWHFAHQILI